MKKNIKFTQQLNQRFLWSLLVIGLIIGVTEYIVMVVLDLLQQSGTILSPNVESLVDTLFLTLISTPLLWFLVLRRLVIGIAREQENVFEQARQNKELRSALDAHALVSIADEKGRIIFANEKFSQVSGYSIEELIGQDHRILNSGIHEKVFFRDLWQTILQGKTWQGVVCNRNKSGTLYWVDSTIMPLLDEERRPRQFISIRRDITLQKSNENRLKILKRAVDACSEMILITNAEGCIQYANPALLEFCYWDNESLLGQPMQVFNSPNNSGDTFKEMEHSLSRNESWAGRLLSRRNGGSALIRNEGQLLPPDPFEFWSETSITPVKNDDGSLFGYVQIIRDISDFVLEEQQYQIEKDDSAVRLEIADILQRDIPLKERFISILENFFRIKDFEAERKAAVFLKSQSEDVFELLVSHGNFSPELLDNWQYVRDGDCLCGRTGFSNTLMISDICTRNPLQEFKLSGIQSHGHTIIPLTTGDEILGLLFLYSEPYPFRHEKRITMLNQLGELMALAILREQAKSTLEQARDMALQASVSKSEFLANVSHEIRTPMNGVIGMLELLNDTELTRTQWELVETAHNSAEALLDIINDILDFSKLEAGKIEVESVSFNLPTIVEEVSSLLARRAFVKGLELNCFLPTNLNPIWKGDPMRIRQVLTNLIGNAIKFTTRGEVSVTLKPLTGEGDQKIFRFEIRDTGIGISPKVQARLFQPFVQAETATARRFGGTGLGLSICKSLIALMGGTIGVDSVADQGSCFWFTIPLMVDPHISLESDIDFSGKRALIIDDNATNRMILKHYLNHWGLLVGEVEDGQSALEELEHTLKYEKHFDIIISDMHMPSMDGLTLAKKISENPLFANIPRILLSSGALIGEEQRIALGFTHSLLKPVRQMQLYDAIADSLSFYKAAEGISVKAVIALPEYIDKKVLVVEDNKVNQKVICGLLAKFKIEPVVAENGQIALDILKEKTFDLILMDCQMPILDGYETTEEIRLREQQLGTARQVIVALTANAVLGEREKCLAAGMDDYLSKPIRREKLTDILAHWLNKETTDPMALTRPSTLSENSEKIESPMVEIIWNEELTLKHLDGDKELLIEMVGLFLEEMPELMTKLREANNKNNIVELGKVAHAIKGSVGHFCANAITEKAASLEISARNNEAIDYQTNVENLNSELNRLMATLSDYADTQQNQG